jgi:hypothetical protein
MAFCPHCGTSLGESATQCSACGQGLTAVAAAKPKGRFKGTMIAMGGQVAGAVAQAAASPGETVSAKSPPAAPLAPPPPPLGAAPGSVQTAAVPGAVKKKHGTMLGVGLPGLAAAAPAVVEPEPLAVEAPATGQSPLPPPRTPAAPRPAASANALARPQMARPEPTSRAIVPTDARATNGPRTGRFVAGSIPPAPPSASPVKLVAVGIAGIVLIAVAGYAIALFLGLVH